MVLPVLQDRGDGSGRYTMFMISGTDAAFEKMDQVREQQERLARLHFELGTTQNMKGQVAIS